MSNSFNSAQRRGEIEIINWFREHHSDKESYLYIVGMGFDSRMCDGIKTFLETNLPFDLWKISIDEGATSPSHKYKELSNRNNTYLNQLIENRNINVTEKRIVFWQNDGLDNRYVGEINAAKLIKQYEKELNNYTSIILDISALPQSVYLCMLNMIMNCCKQTKIYIMVNENYRIDLNTKPIENEEFAHEMHGFTSPTEDMDSIIIWYPVLGEVNPELLKKHHEYLRSNTKRIDEICPIVPFPSVDAKRADDIVKGYRKELFSDWNVDKNNIIFASEKNPIRVCDVICDTSHQYIKVLKPLGNCKFVISAITSKLMSIGTLLAIYKLRLEGANVSVLSVNNKGYRVDKNNSDTETVNELTCVKINLN